jgi:hypothetical protein
MTATTSSSSGRLARAATAYYLAAEPRDHRRGHPEKSYIGSGALAATPHPRELPDTRGGRFYKASVKLTRASPDLDFNLLFSQQGH